MAQRFSELSQEFKAIVELLEMLSVLQMASSATVL